MAIKVNIPSNASTTKVSIPTTGTIASVVTTQSQAITNAKLQNLANIDISTNGLLDGHTLVYDEETGNFVAQALTASVDIDSLNLTSLDGGTY
tara:strand:- start:310 stop:588 length:279 start_codon:yes stop_codon:yes gene_type:complete